MSRYKKYLVFILILIAFFGCSKYDTYLKVKKNKKVSNLQTKNYKYEDPYIMFALEYERQKKYSNAKTLYKKLFDNTNKYEYFLKFVTLSFHQKDYDGVIKIINNKILNDLSNQKQEESILRIYAFSLLKKNRGNEAIKIAQKVLKINNNHTNYELLGSLYLDKKKYKKSYEQFNKSYKKAGNVSTFLTLTNIQYFYLDEKEEATKEIEKYFDEKGYNYPLSLQLLFFYEKNKEKEKTLDLLNRLYKDFKDKKNTTAYKKIRDILIKYLINDNVKKAIDFVKMNNENDYILLSLYKSSNMLTEQYNLLSKMYLKTNNYNYLAELAILEFEKSNNKNKVLKSVIEKFYKALEHIDNSVYENYLAYLLIDYDIDIKEGIRYVNKALLKEPNNIAYIDTLAWGEYKQNNCKKAYKLMKEVVDKVGLDDIEIKLHWEKIKECSK